MSFQAESIHDPQKYDLANLAKVGWGIAAAELSSNCYSVAVKFRKGDIQALETEMLARWAGDNRYDNQSLSEKIERLQTMVASLYVVVDKVFRQSEYSSTSNTSNVVKDLPEIDYHILEELDIFGLVTRDDEKSLYSLNKQGAAFVEHMYQKYVVGLQPNEASKKSPCVWVYGQSRPA